MLPPGEYKRGTIPPVATLFCSLLLLSFLGAGLLTASSSYRNITSSSSSLDVSSPPADCRLSAEDHLTYTDGDGGGRWLLDRRSRSVADLMSDCALVTIEHDIGFHKSRAATLTHKSTAAAVASGGTLPRSPAHKLLGCLRDFHSKRMKKKCRRRRVAAADAANDNRDRMPSV